ncbi:Nramp family divalent metal transporter [Leptolinea tardivitalis]|uniref:Divalent metal cation transporter MntH n=1 Tax=Leptolinea tardivitalis TaxID=229920 RepID=A0A0P6X0Z8_9CHLR|nr:manganese transport protein MntH [Leptolinea tardivitalis]GAP21210.1 NRAMP (natural resistance-associated macrophage protein) metal ion transporter [Leptolinea tardivitalis]
MKKEIPKKSSSKETVEQAKQVLQGKAKKSGFRKIAPFLGPAFIASVAYVDPGNFATNIQSGAQFGYLLLWVIIGSNIMAMLVQTLSAKLGIATGKNLAEICRERFPKPVVWIMWALMEIVAMATDLAEFLGAALGFNLLLGVPLYLAGILTAIATFLILGFEKSGFRSLETIITAFVGVIAIAYVVETFLDKPDWGLVANSILVPRFAGTESVLLATGILGATVMPHAIFLHSALTQNRIVVRKPKLMQKLFRYEQIDVFIAMGAASLINAAMLIMAASTFHRSGLTSVGTIEQAYITLEPLLGKAASWVFGLSLLASGLSSASVGTMAGQVIMQGFLHFEIPVWIRRLVTMIPSLIVIFIGLEPTRTLVISQVALSFGLPFAIIPLVYFTAKKDIMGVLVNHKLTTIAASLVALLIVVLNVFLIVNSIGKGI